MLFGDVFSSSFLLFIKNFFQQQRVINGIYCGCRDKWWFVRISWFSGTEEQVVPYHFILLWPAGVRPVHCIIFRILIMRVLSFLKGTSSTNNPPTLIFWSFLQSWSRKDIMNYAVLTCGSDCIIASPLKSLQPYPCCRHSCFLRRPLHNSLNSKRYLEFNCAE